MTDIDLKNEQAVVVGATGAFGQAIVKRLTNEGLEVIAVARTEASLESLVAENDRVKACIADVSSDTAIDDIKAAITKPIRMVVHGPGVAVAGGVLNAPTDALVNAVNIKVGGYLRVVRAVDEHVVESSRLIAIGGHYGLEPTAYAAAAGVANAALFNISRQVSLAYGERGVTSHVIAPGPADTERLRNVAKDRAKMLGITVEEVMATMCEESSTGRFTTPEQVAWAVAILLDPAADAMTGSTLMLDSGRRKGLP